MQGVLESEFGLNAEKKIASMHPTPDRQQAHPKRLQATMPVKETRHFTRLVRMARCHWCKLSYGRELARRPSLRIGAHH